MLQLTNVSKSYGVETVLRDVSFILNRGDRAGLVGPNGSGKTTLLRIIARLEVADAGQVSLASSATLGYLPQGSEAAWGHTVGEVIRSALSEWQRARERVEDLAAKMAQSESADSARWIAEYGEALIAFEAAGGYEIESRISSVLDGLGLAGIDQDAPVQRLSGGQRTRLGLARLLISEPHLLLLDEPTNHLDIEALEWLEEFLQSYRGAALIVSHDRTFLDRTVTRILEMDQTSHRIRQYAGNYGDYEEAKERERERQFSAWKDQQAEIVRLQSAARRLRKNAQFRRGGKADTNDKFAKGFFANRGLETVRRAKSIEKRIEHLQTDEKIDKPQQAWRMRLDFGEMPRSGQVVLTLEDLGHRFDDRWLFRHANLRLEHGARIALVGPNGTGKTTLLRIIVGALTPAEGQVRLGSNVRLGYMPQEQESLDPGATPLSLVRELAPLNETDARHLLHFFLFAGDEVFTPIAQLSYGQRARLLLAKLVVAGANCLVLDEPINHLDIPSRERFEAALEAFPGTVLVAAHDRAFIDRFASGIWAMEDSKVVSR